MSPKFLLSLAALALVLTPAAVPAPSAEPAVTFNVTNVGLTAYSIDGVSNPDLQLNRGETYTFQINAPGHPFWIKIIQSIGTVNAYSGGVTGNGTDSGTLTFAVPIDAPATLYYDCQYHASMTGKITTVDAVPVLPKTWGNLKALFLER